MTSLIENIAEMSARILKWALVVLFTILVLDVLWGVFSRYVIGQQSRWTEEVAINLLIWVSLLGAAYTFREKGHLGFDYLVSKFDPAAQRITNFVIILISVVFIVYVFIFGGSSLMSRSLAGGQITPALGWKVGYFYSVIPISGIFFIIFAIEQLVKDFKTEEIDDR